MNTFHNFLPWSVTSVLSIKGKAKTKHKKKNPDYSNKQTKNKSLSKWDSNEIFLCRGFDKGKVALNIVL